MIDPLDAQTAERLAKCAVCSCQACLAKQEALAASYSVHRRIALVLQRRTALLRRILQEGRIEQGDLRDAIEEECR